MYRFKNVLYVILLIIITEKNHAQFLDSFDSEKINGWFFFTGDGNAKMDFRQMNGYARIFIDATDDKHNVYWTIIKRDVTSYLDLKKLMDTTYQLRVEARVKVHNAPRRLNFMVNTQRTTNYHIDLMEYDISDTTDWHVISMTTKRFDAVPGDTVYVQLAATDFGIGKYIVDVDYYRADIVNTKEAGPDKGVLVPYHPPMQDLEKFKNIVDVTHDCLINMDFPDVNFNNWHAIENNREIPVLTINGNQWAILRWDLKQFSGSKAEGAGILELTTHSVLKGGDYFKTFGNDLGIEFGKVRIIEIPGGDKNWDQNDVTYNTLVQSKKYSEVFNEQMIFDTEVAGDREGKTYITISQPIMQRLLDGKTKGILIRPLGSINASFFASENGLNSPKLYFNIMK